MKFYNNVLELIGRTPLVKVTRMVDSGMATIYMKMENLKQVGKTKAGHSWWEVTLQEGKTRQIRRMMKAVGHPVQKLKRVSVGPVKLGQMKPGEVRELTKRELDAIRRETNQGGAHEGT